MSNGEKFALAVFLALGIFVILGFVYTGIENACLNAGGHFDLSEFQCVGLEP
jgi:hypothetical protein